MIFGITARDNLPFQCYTVTFASQKLFCMSVNMSKVMKGGPSLLSNHRAYQACASHSRLHPRWRPQPCSPSPTRAPSSHADSCIHLTAPRRASCSSRKWNKPKNDVDRMFYTMAPFSRDAARQPGEPVPSRPWGPHFGFLHSFSISQD